MLTCRELIEFLDQFVADELPPGQKASFREHLRVCPDCRAYLDSYRQTIALAKLSATLDDKVSSDVPPALIKAVCDAMTKA